MIGRGGRRGAAVVVVVGEDDVLWGMACFAGVLLRDMSWEKSCFGLVRGIALLCSKALLH